MSSNPTLADVRKRRDEIAEIIRPLTAEDKELEIAERVLLRLSAVSESIAGKQAEVVRSPPPPPPPPPAAAPPAPVAAAEQETTLTDEVRAKLTGKETLEQLVEILLDECGDDWWLATEIQEHLIAATGRDIPMSSLSPTLTAMKNKGTLVRDGLQVGLASRGLTNKAAAE